MEARLMNLLPDGLRPDMYGTFLRTVALLLMHEALAQRLPAHGHLMWVHAVFWFELARYVDPKGHHGAPV